MKKTMFLLIAASLLLSGCGMKTSKGFWYSSSLKYDYGHEVVSKNPHLSECFGLEWFDTELELNRIYTEEIEKRYKLIGNTVSISDTIRYSRLLDATTTSEFIMAHRETFDADRPITEEGKKFCRNFRKDREFMFADDPL